MQLFFKTVVYFLIIFSLTQNIFCQEELITTKFIQDGTLYKNIDKPSQAVAQFKENEKCVVISFLGNYVYKIKYKEWEGFVKDQYLVINEAMMDLYFDHEEKERLKAIKERELRQEKIQKIKQEVEDSIARINEEKERKQNVALQQEIIKQEQIDQKRREDSIVKIKEAERKQVEALQKQRLLQEQINQKRLDDSIAKINAESIKDTNSLERNESLNTCKYLINKYDEYYKQMVIITDKYEINPNLNIELIREGNSSKININLSEDLGCVSYVPATRSTVRVTLENNQVIIFYHSGSLDCTDFSLKALLPESKIKQLKQSAIKSFTLKGTKGTVTISDIDYRDFFIDKLKCIE